MQGTGAEILKKAMIRIREILKKQNLESDVRMLLQVHDELVFEVKEDKIEIATKIIKETMENIEKFSIPLVVEVGVAKNWTDAH